MTMYRYRPQAAKQYADTLNAFAEKTNGRYGLSAMVVPSAITFLENEKLRKLSPSQKQPIEEVAKHLTDAVRFVSIYETLERRAAGGEYIYFRSDHHWTALGAYYAYAEYAEAAGLQPLAIDEYERKDLGEFLGTTYNATLSKSVAAEPDNLTVYLPKLNYSYVKIRSGFERKSALIDEEAKGYGVFLGGDSALSIIKTKLDTGKKLLVIKDSYANAFIPFLAPHYDEIHIIDLRYYEDDVYKYLEKRSIGEILFINSVNVTSHPGYTQILADKLDLEVEKPKY